MSTITRARFDAVRSKESHPAVQLALLGALAVIVSIAAGAFAGILTYVVGLAALAAHAADRATQPRRPSARGAASERLRAAGRAETRP